MSHSDVKPCEGPSAFEVIIDKSDLLKELSIAQGVVERKITIPILSSFLFETSGHNVLISATDLDLSLRTFCAATVKKQGSCTIPARKLYDYAKLLPDGEITIKSLPNGWVQIRCGRSHTKMVGLHRAHFPDMPVFPAETISLPRAPLRSMIQKTNFAVCEEDSKYTLNAALLILTPDLMTMIANRRAPHGSCRSQGGGDCPSQ